MKTGQAKARKSRSAATKGKHFRMSIDLLDWLISHAKERGYNNDSELLREIVRDYRERVEGLRAA